MNEIRTREDVALDRAVARSALTKLEHAGAGFKPIEAARQRFASLTAELQAQGWSPQAAQVRANVLTQEQRAQRAAEALEYFTRTGWSAQQAAELAEIHAASDA